MIGIGIVVFALTVGAWSRALETVGVESTARTERSAIAERPRVEPDPDTFATWRFERAMTIPIKAFLPIPSVGVRFWNHNVLESVPLFGRVELAVSCLILAWWLLVIIRRPTAALMYGTGLAGLLALIAFVYYGALRHHGFLFVLFLAVAWVSRYCPVLETRRTRGLSHALERSLSPAVTVILAIHLLGGAIAVWMDRIHPFSQGQRTAEFIRDRGLGGGPIVGSPDLVMPSIIGYLDKKQFYFPETDTFGSFIPFDVPRHTVSDREVVDSASRLGAQRGEDVLVVLNHRLPNDLVAQNNVKELARMAPATVDGEEFVLYQLRR